MGQGNYLFCSDTQGPYQISGCIRFLKRVQKEYKIEKENVYHVGDETDGYNGSDYPKSPDAKTSPMQEIAETKEFIKEFSEAFPLLKIAHSNHMLRWPSKAKKSMIPIALLKEHKEIIGAPDGWIWKPEWIIKDKHTFRMIHGVGYSGKDGARNAAIDAGMSTVIGHIHSFAGISIIRTGGVMSNKAALEIWAMNVGCLIDIESYAFDYGKDNRSKPCLGAGVVIDSGKRPIWIPYED